MGTVAGRVPSLGCPWGICQTAEAQAMGGGPRNDGERPVPPPVCYSPALTRQSHISRSPGALGCVLGSGCKIKVKEFWVQP